jgi:hypothetical protein
MTVATPLRGVGLRIVEASDRDDRPSNGPPATPEFNAV